MNQTEYGMAYAIVIGMILLGVLAVCIPRPRKTDLPENLEKERKFRESDATRRRSMPQAYRKARRVKR